MRVFLKSKWNDALTENNNAWLFNPQHILVLTVVIIITIYKEKYWKYDCVWIHKELYLDNIETHFRFLKGTEPLSNFQDRFLLALANCYSRSSICI